MCHCEKPARGGRRSNLVEYRGIASSLLSVAPRNDKQQIYFILIQKENKVKKKAGYLIPALVNENKTNLS